MDFGISKQTLIFVIMNPLADILAQWEQLHLISSEERQRLQTLEKHRPVSVWWLLRTWLYVGILLFTSGAGLLIYKNIDTIGHQAIIGLLSVLMLGCFYYTYQHSAPFSKQEVETETKFVDFALLLGCTLFLSLEGYVQWQYNLFGTRYGLATVLPAILFMFCAYRFDHRGVLSMGLTALASWVGLTITPLEVWQANDFSGASAIYTALAFGQALIGVGLVLHRFNIKQHFTYTYLLLNGNLLFVSALVGLFSLDEWPLYVVLIGGWSWFFVWYARQYQSFLFLLMAAVYGYIAFTYLIFKVMDESFWVFLGFFYFVISAAGVVWFLVNFKKLLKKK